MSRNKWGRPLRQRIETKAGTALLQALGSAIAEAREDVGITQTELARRARVSRFQMCKHEAGTAEMPITRLFEICSALKVEPSSFLRAVAKDVNGG